MTPIDNPARHVTVANDRPRDGRIAYLDGLRAVAIILVILFHSYSTWTDLIPAFKPFRDVLLLNTKSAGVQLFFFISGFVILMTLEKSRGYGSFLFARWRRLFPAMLIASIMIFATAPFLAERPRGQPNLIDLLPGLSLLGNYFWNIPLFWLTPPPQSLEAVFWSLYVEVFFYLIFAAIFLSRGVKVAIGALIGIGVVTSLFHISEAIDFQPFTTLQYFDERLDINRFARIFGLWYYTWFAGGALAYCWTKAPDNKRLIWGAIACLAFGAATTFAYPAASALVAVIAIAAMVSPLFQRVLSLPALTFLGFISYPLYLNHEGMVVALTIRIQAHWPWVPPILMPVLPILLAGIIATLVAKYAEPFVRRMIDTLIARLRSAIRRATTAEMTNR